MNYRIVGDSCTDLTAEMKKDTHFYLVPLSIDIDGERFEDDETFNQQEFIKKMTASPNAPKSSCPAPEAYMEAYDVEGDIYVVTLTANLSGSYNSAELAKKLFLEEHPDKKIAVFNSCSASSGQMLIAIKIQELLNAGTSFEDVVDQVNEYIAGQQTKFVLESLENLRKNGRLSNMKAFIASALNIKPVMEATQDGQIAQLTQARGINKALKTMVDLIQKDVKDPMNRIVGIAHCNNFERAKFVKEEILSKIPFKSCIITEMAGISTLYANDGGIIVSY